MAKQKFRQCVLRRDEGVWNRQQTSWIPEKFAVVGKTVKLRGKEWEVIRAGSNATDEPPDYRSEIKRHRRNTGDALPK